MEPRKLLGLRARVGGTEGGKEKGEKEGGREGGREEISKREWRRYSNEMGNKQVIKKEHIGNKVVIAAHGSKLDSSCE